MSTDVISAQTFQTLVPQLRAQFPALGRRGADDQHLVFLDGPAGTQVPQSVLDAITAYLVECNANRHGCFVTAEETEAMFRWAQRRYAEFFGVGDPDEIVFGPNMTSLTFALSRSIARTWNPGDEIILTRLDHDANVSPWHLAARDRGVNVKWVPFNREDFQLDCQALQEALSPKTRLVAFGAASNATGGLSPVAEICRMVRDAGALSYVDAVHLGPHRLLETTAWEADFVVCSAYKFFGPHVGILWGRRSLLESLEAYKVRPASDRIPEKWMSGTQNHEGIAGAAAAVEYLQQIGARLSGDDPSDQGRACLQNAFQAITIYEQELSSRLLDGLEQIGGFTVYGIDAQRFRQAEYQPRRVSTFSIRHQRVPPAALAQELAKRGILCWHGNYYALELSEQLGLEPEGMLRIGLLHYNTVDEVARLLSALQEIVA